MQLCATIVIIAIAIAYACYRVYLVLTDENEACKGCALAKKCTKKRKKRENIWRCREKTLPLHPHS